MSNRGGLRKILYGNKKADQRKADISLICNKWVVALWSGDNLETVKAKSQGHAEEIKKLWLSTGRKS